MCKGSREFYLQYCLAHFKSTVARSSFACVALIFPHIRFNRSVGAFALHVFLPFPRKQV